MSETPPDPADVHTGTDRVADVEAQIQADFEAHPGSWRGDPEGWFREGWLVQEARVQALTADRDRLQMRLEYGAENEIDMLDGLHDQAIKERDSARAELAAANARCAELRGEHDGGSFWSQAEWSDWSNNLARLVPEEYEDDVAQEAIIERALADLVTKAATLDRVTAEITRLADDPGIHPRWEALLRAALTPEGTE